MTDDPDPPTPVVKLVPPPFDPMKERGARTPEPPKPGRNPLIDDPESGDLAVLVAQAITLRGAEKRDIVPHWISADVIKTLDPYTQAPELVRRAARIMLRDLAEQTMRAYRPPDDALKLIEEADAAEVKRRAAEDAALAFARRIPATCGLCGKPCAEERHSLILGTAPKTRICEACIFAAVVNELDRHHRRAAAEEVRKLEAESVGVTRGQLRAWDRMLGNIEPWPRRPKRER
jgi:hypothetical protein